MKILVQIRVKNSSVNMNENSSVNTRIRSATTARYRLVAVGICWKYSEEPTVKLCDNLFVISGNVTCKWTDIQ